MCKKVIDDLSVEATPVRSVGWLVMQQLIFLVPLIIKFSMRWKLDDEKVF